MSIKRPVFGYDGEEVRLDQIEQLATASGSADDAAIAETYSTIPAGGSRDKVIVPPGGRGATAANSAVLTPHAALGATVYVNPFRVILGAAPSSVYGDHEIVSALHGVELKTLAANSSGNDRYDTIYAIVTVDAPSAATTALYKDPSSGTENTVSTNLYVQTTVTTAVIQGTPSGSPTIPSVPADSGNVYNVFLGAVKVPNGTTSSTLFTTAQIYEGYALPGGIAGPASAFTAAVPDATTGIARRAATAMPSSMAGREERWFPIATSSVLAPWPSGQVLDNSIDWRNRFFDIRFGSTGTTSHGFSWSSTGQTAVPSFNNGLSLGELGNSFHVDATTTRRTVLLITNAFDVNMPAGKSVEIYVDDTTGALTFYKSDNTFTYVAMVHLVASGMMANPYA